MTCAGKIGKMLAAALAFCLLTGCAHGAGPSPDPTETIAAAETKPPLLDSLSEYTLVRADEADADIVAAAISLREELNALSGGELLIATDWVKRGENPDTAGEHEILVGMTNRSASLAAGEGLGLLDFSVLSVDGDIVLAAGSAYSLEMAAAKLVELLRAGESELSYIYRYEPSANKEGITMFRAASYNIRHGADVNMDMQILADDITGLGIDVVGLQEVDIHAARSGNIDTMRELSEKSGMPYYAFARGIPLGSGEYGTGILSRWPIVSFEVTELESGSCEQRSIGHAVLDVNGTPVHFFNTHLSYEEKALRDAQFAQIAEMLPRDEPYLLTGDFNTQDFAEFAPLNYGYLLNHAENRKASFYPSSSAIDNIVLSADFSVLDEGMLEVKHSDHYMIWCDIVIKGEDKT